MSNADPKDIFKCGGLSALEVAVNGELSNVRYKIQAYQGGNIDFEEMLTKVLKHLSQAAEFRRFSMVQQQNEKDEL